MRDITLEDTFRHPFTTRAFATGVPTVLSGTPVLSVLEENNATPITSGVSVSVDRASVVGLNEATIVATAANGFENGKSYGIYISTGTVGGVSVIGEVVGNFTIGLSAAAVDLANGTDGLTALKTGIDAIPTTAMRGTDNALLAANINLTAGVLDEVAALTGQTAQTGDNFARIGTPIGADISADIAAVKADTIIPAKNVAFPNISVLMVDDTDHVTPKTGLSVTGQRSIDGAAFGNVTGSIAEISNGIYQFDATQADMNGDVITFKFSGTDADDTFLTIVTR